MMVMHSSAITSASAIIDGMITAHSARPMMKLMPASRRMVSSASCVRPGASFTISHAKPIHNSIFMSCEATSKPVPTAAIMGRNSFPPGHFGAAVTRWPPTVAPGSSCNVPPMQTTSPSTRASAPRLTSPPIAVTLPVTRPSTRTSPPTLRTSPWTSWPASTVMSLPSRTISPVVERGRAGTLGTAGIMPESSRLSVVTTPSPIWMRTPPSLVVVWICSRIRTFAASISRLASSRMRRASALAASVAVATLSDGTGRKVMLCATASAVRAPAASVAASAHVMNLVARMVISLRLSR